MTEAGGEPCTVADCHTGIESVGDVELRGHLFGIETHSQDCHVEAVLRVAGDGTAGVSNAAFTPGDANCANVVACQAPWLAAIGETDVGVAGMNVSLCLDGTPLGECVGTVGLVMSEASNHRYEWSVVDGSFAGESFGKCELTGTWQQVAPTEALEVVHSATP